MAGWMDGGNANGLTFLLTVCNNDVQGVLHFNVTWTSSIRRCAGAACLDVAHAGVLYGTVFAVLREGERAE